MNTPVNIATLHASIKSALTAGFSGTAVDYYARQGERVAVPAIFFELEEVTADDPDDIGTEQLAVRLKFNGYVVNSYKAGNKLGIRTAAVALMQFIRGKRWGQPVGAANVIGAFPDTMQGQPDDYEVMRVEWEHEALLGTDIWPGGIVPSEVWLGISPLIGPENLEHYVLLDTERDLPSDL